MSHLDSIRGKWRTGFRRGVKPDGWSPRYVVVHLVRGVSFMPLFPWLPEVPWLVRLDGLLG